MKSFLTAGQGMWLGYVRAGSVFNWVSGCSSTFTQWNTNKPDGGAYAGSGAAGNWDDSDVSTFFCSCQFKMSAAPTAAPSFAPSFTPTTRPPSAKPTPAPTTVAPSIVPTAVPTVPYYDCSASCSIIGSTALAVTGNQLIATVKISNNFKITFDATAAGLATYPQVRNMLTIETSGGADVFTVGLPNSNNLRMAYNGVVANDFGPALVTGYTTTFTTITTGYAYGSVKSTATYSTDNTVATFIDVSAMTLNLYLSANDGTNPTAGGSIKNLVISCKLYLHGARSLHYLFSFVFNLAAVCFFAQP
jgi:hypothetical protein